MRKALAVLIVPAALAIGACGDDDEDRADTSAKTCRGQFEATVHRGPTKGLAVEGELTLRVEPSGSASGTVKQRDGSLVMADGQVDGRAISLAMDAGEGRTLYGTGVSSDGDVSDCAGEMGGTLAGPQPGDAGDWGYAIGG
jgi:hypothetical protein